MAKMLTSCFYLCAMVFINKIDLTISGSSADSFQVRTVCEDKEEWCGGVKNYCETQPAIMEPMCPVTCGVCNRTDGEDESETAVSRPGLDLLKLCSKEHACEQNCELLNGIEVCSCGDGYELEFDGKSCRDIDECAVNPCQGTDNPICTNTEGSYVCGPETGCGAGHAKYFEGDECCKLSEGSCGRNSANGGFEIAGPDSIVVRWPWMSLIAIFSTNFCGGILVTRNWVLAPAHCFQNASPGDVQAYFGIISTNRDDGIKVYSQGRRILRIVIHPQYRYPVNDLAVIRVTRPVALTDYVGIACLPQSELPSIGSRCWATAYGVSEDMGEEIRTLLQEPILIKDNFECVSSPIDNVELHDQAICGARTNSSWITACQGSTGGPVVCQRCSSCDWYVTGLSLSSTSCQANDTHIAYTSIVKHEQWLKRTMNLRALGTEMMTSCQNVGKVRPIDQSDGEWTSWSECTATCGEGTSSRRRFCSGRNTLLNGCSGDEEETRNCKIQECATWEEFSEWSKCTKTCNNGSRSRIRKCINGESGTSGCVGAPKETEICNPQACPKWSRWGKWQKCNVTCGRGKQLMQRQCTNGEFGDRGCKGKHTRSRTCIMKKCPVWTAWSAWSECSQTCGNGTIHASRECKLGKKRASGCPGNATLTKVCNSGDCEAKEEWAEWSLWSACDVTCGIGKKRRERDCLLLETSCTGPPFEEMECETAQCETAFTEWSTWSQCSATCGISTRSRRRTCIQFHLCALFNQPLQEVQECILPQCSARDLKICSASCGGGVRFKRGGQDRDAVVLETCNTHACPTYVSYWSTWGPCSRTCGTGNRKRTRTCLRRYPQCEEELEETDYCIIKSCSGIWSQWDPWGPCSTACGVGNIRRFRTCLGGNCPGTNVQVETCVASDCPPGGPCADEASMVYLCPLLTGYCENGYMRFSCRKTCQLC